MAASKKSPAGAWFQILEMNGEQDRRHRDLVGAAKKQEAAADGRGRRRDATALADRIARGQLVRLASLFLSCHTKQLWKPGHDKEVRFLLAGGCW